MAKHDREQQNSRVIRAISVDDEPLAHECIRVALEPEADIEIVAECLEGTEAVRVIGELNPNLVFLDVQMPGLSGFEVVEQIGVDLMPPVVFITAYDEHAVQAFEMHAIDYVLKPFEDDRLISAVKQVRRRLRADDDAEFRSRLSELVTSSPSDEYVKTPKGHQSEPAYASRLAVRDRGTFRFVQTEDIDWLEASGNRVRIHVGTQSHIIRATLSGTAERLDPTTFVRIHRSTVVNVARIREVQPWLGGDYVAILHDGRELKVSRVYRDRLLRPSVRR